jgi:aryl-alcohol dehydrogenase-like predicted oxidoreductase
MTRATPESTTAYTAKFPSAASGHFRQAQGLTLSSIGIGTYLGHPNPQTDASYTASAIAAVESGINVIDSAINYRFQRSERSIGAALQQLTAKGFPREQLVLCTKAGFLTPDGNMPSDPNEYFFREYIQPGILTAKDIVGGGHCMTPRFLANQIDRSLKNLGIHCIDVFYLHNPETQLSEIPKPEFLMRVRSAFEFLESTAAAGKIQFYGMATWTGFRQQQNARDALQLAEIAAIAHEVAGEKHRFRFVQLPFNLGMTEVLTLGNQWLESQGQSGPHKTGQHKTMAEAAGELGITLIGSGSLLQAQLTHDLPPFVSEALGLDSDAARALQFARCVPGITTALVGMSRPEHVRANTKLVSIPPAGVDQFTALFTRGE